MAGMLMMGLATATPVEDLPADPVVVATFDTGTNPFHPCFRRSGTHGALTMPGFPASAKPLQLSFKSSYDESLANSASALEGIQDHTLYYVNGTNLMFYGGAGARTQFIDDFPHGAQASSQIGCSEFGLAPNALLLVLNWYDAVNRVELVRWVAEQSWIDVVHLNIQDGPRPVPLDSNGIPQLIDNGKMVVIAAGNGVQGGGVNYPMELSRFNGPAGSLIAGANDNDGTAYYSNLDPHVVMDGCGTAAAAPYAFGSTRFGGTSSASPRITGYVARLIGILRARFGHAGASLLTIPPANPRPSSGALADGALTSAELHEAVRKTANPNPHYSRFDSQREFACGVPMPVGAYPKTGYGEVSEHTLGAAVNVLAGDDPMPVRPVEDAFYTASEAFRSGYWGTQVPAPPTLNETVPTQDDARSGSDAPADREGAPPIAPGPIHEATLSASIEVRDLRPLLVLVDDDWFALSGATGDHVRLAAADVGGCLTIYEAELNEPVARACGDDGVTLDAVLPQNGPFYVSFSGRTFADAGEYRLGYAINASPPAM